MITAIILISLFLICALQLVIAIHAFRISTREGLLCLFFPLYVYFFARKTDSARKWLLTLYAALGLLLVGVILAAV
ncbi:hypothetical protein [Paludibacterium purpuratum]|uniref:Uncharacterized protein n=1 Tax=Paludibacterium purpuratum TaxID=1144873 RepID=A0A4R7B137_9NEIS|nr:hypothetical protein [Paludibacterium purpuratum]TDR76609.1 hypothetical protein DFP86_11035 [Paludibacterium purpuratum]